MRFLCWAKYSVTDEFKVMYGSREKLRRYIVQSLASTSLISIKTSYSSSVITWGQLGLMAGNRSPKRQKRSGLRGLTSLRPEWVFPAQTAGSFFLQCSCYLGVVFHRVPHKQLFSRPDWLKQWEMSSADQSQHGLLWGSGEWGGDIWATVHLICY